MAPPTARRNVAIAATIMYFVTLPFLILVAIGNTHINNILNDLYFYKFDVSQIIPITGANSNLLNSIARDLGLHDFYSVGLFNFCEGYLHEGVTHCSTPTAFYWFNPIDVVLSDVLAGAKIPLPPEVKTVLTVLRIGQRLMYGFFLSGTVVNFVLMLTTLLVVRTRWWTLPVAFFAGISGTMVTVAAIIATAISIAAKVALTAQDQINIRAEIGVKVFAFMWIAAILTDIAFLFHAAMGFCCRPEKGRPSSQENSVSEVKEKKNKIALPTFVPFVRRRRGAAAVSSSGALQPDT